MEIAAICRPENICKNAVFAVASGAVAMVAAAAVGAPILVGSALGALTALVSTFALDFFKQPLHELANQRVAQAISAVIHIVSSLAVAGVVVLLGASVTFAAAAFIAFIGLAIATPILIAINDC